MRYSIVVPVYLNAESIPTLVDQLVGIREELDSELELVFVVDGSPDDSSTLLRELLPSIGIPSQLIVLSRNFGSFAAIRAGLNHTTGEFCAVMAADLQDPPELMTRFFKILESGDADVVIGTRSGRADPWTTRLASRIFWGLYRALVEPDVPRRGVDVFGCNRRFVDQLLQMRESNTSLIGLLFWLGFRRREVPYQRRKRPHGRSGWSWRRKLTYLMDSLFSFSDLPVRLLMAMGGLGLTVALVTSIVVTVVRLSTGYPVPGFAMTIVLISFFMGLNSLGLGLVGSYTWRAYENTKVRPDYVVMDRDVYPPRSPT